jgi:SAM-dependent MidA family methyltransferase
MCFDLAGKNIGDNAAVNKSYYSQKGSGIYEDFSTFAQGRVISECNAIEFVRDFSNRSNEITVCEYGVGRGDFAKTFLSEVKRRSPKLYSRTRYHLFDLSGKMLAAAKENLSLHEGRCSFQEFDAAMEIPSFAFDYCRINELLSDLPAEIYARKGNSTSTSNIFVQKFLSRMDDGRKIPFSFAAEKFLLALCTAGKRNFRIDVFDYGFYTADDIFSMPREEWNSLVAREYGGQITVDVNFLQLVSALAAEQYDAKVERQKEYAERVMGAKLEISQTERGLDYKLATEPDIEEDDDFHHLRIGW